MYRIEKTKHSGCRERWEPASDETYPTLEEATTSRRLAVERALRDAKKSGAWKTPRFRIVRAFPVVECAGLQ